MITNVLTGLILGSTPAAIVLGEAAITGKTAIGLNEAVAVGLTVAGLVWWLGRQFREIQTRLKRHSKLLEFLLEKQGIDPRLVGDESLDEKL